MTKFSRKGGQYPAKNQTRSLVIGYWILVIVCILFLGYWCLTGVSLAKEPDAPVVKNLVVDRGHKAILYELTKPATVSIRVGSKSGPLYRTLINWQRQNKGKHTIKWDGLDTSKAFNILDNKDFTFSFNYYLANEDKPIIRDYFESTFIVSDNFIGRAPKFTHLSQLHKNHKKEHCKDTEVLFELPKDTQKTKQGLAEIKGLCPITIELAAGDKVWFRRERFSINIFIDDVFIKGEALGYSPYTWNFIPLGINKGKHLITVNLKGFNDHIAIGSLAIYVATTDYTDEL